MSRDLMCFVFVMAILAGAALPGAVHGQATSPPAAWEEQWERAGAVLHDEARGRTHHVASVDELEDVLANNVGPGDVVVMRDGRWEDAVIRLDVRGTAERPIVLRAETPGEVHLTGSSQIDIAGEHLVIYGLTFRDGYLDEGAVIRFSEESRHARLTECAVINYNPPEGETRYNWITLRGRFHRIDHNRLEGQNHAGRFITAPILEEPEYHRIDNNHFGPRSVEDKSDLRHYGGATMLIGNSFSSMWNARIVVENNYFEYCKGHGELISNKTCENTYRNNTFIESWGALTLRHGERCIVKNNYFIGNRDESTGGIRVINPEHAVINNYIEGMMGRGRNALVQAFNVMSANEDPELHQYDQVVDTLIAHNTIVNSDYSVTFATAADTRDLPRPPKNVTFANNLVYSEHPPLVRIIDPASEIHWQSNIFYGAGLGIDPIDGIIQEDPRLTRDEHGIYRPGPDSPVIGAGTDLDGQVGFDIDGNPRDERVDIGSHQFTDEPTRGPLTPEEVGPAWWPRSAAQR